MELRHLRYFVTVAEMLNFTKAASRLRVAQPALSRQIRDLEDELGAPLLERGPRVVRLTAAGATFLSEAKAVLQRAEEAVKATRAVVRGERGEIQVGYAPSPTVELLPCALHAFQNIAPEVRVTLHDLSTEEMMRGMADGKLNICLMVQPSAKTLRGLKFEMLCEYPVCVAVQPSHRFARMKRVAVEEIFDEPIVAFERADYPEYHAMLESLFQPHNRKARVVEEHSSGPGLIAAIAIGRGIAILPSCLAILTGARAKLVPLHPPPPPVPVGAMYDQKQILPAAEKFLAAARSASQSKLGRK